MADTDDEHWGPQANPDAVIMRAVEDWEKPPPPTMEGWSDDLTHAGQFAREWHKRDTLSGAYQTQDCHGNALPLPHLEPPAD
eukprot:5041089-Prorocentrum_lima.AAC.1